MDSRMLTSIVTKWKIPLKTGLLCFYFYFLIWQTERDLLSTGLHTPNAYNNWAGLKPEAGNWTQISHKDGKDPMTWSIPRFLPEHTLAELEVGMGLELKPRHFNMEYG